MILPEHVRNLTADQVECVLRDLELIDAGYRLNLCIDPYEIFDFCIPVNPDRRGSRDIDLIADDQASLYHAFFNWGRKPILIPEYRAEVERLIRYFEHAVGEAYSRRNLVNVLIQEATEAPTARTPEKRMSILEEEFSKVLAVTMGIYSVGVERLREVINHRLDKKPVNEELQNEWDKADSSGLKNVINDSLVDDLTRQLQRGDINDAEFKQRTRSAETDAIAISRLIHMNQKALGGSRRERRGRDLFLYVSTAPRSRRIFNIPDIINAQPKIDGRSFNMWRTRAQVFVYSLHNVTYHSYDPSLDPRKYLEQLKPIIAETERYPHITKQCSKCVLNGGDGEDTCKFVKLCDMVQRLDDGILAARKQMRNLALVKSLENYRRFQEAKPTSKDEITYIKFFKELFAADELQDSVLGRIRELQRLVVIKGEFKENMPALYNYGREMIKKTHVDVITNPIQALPTYLALASPVHREIVSTVVRFHKQPDLTAASPLLDAYDKFVESDKEHSQLRREHEIVRCFLYMACVGLAGNDLASRHAQELEREFRKSAEKADLWYIQAWALRRAGHYPEADELLTRAVKKYPKDPRMWHGRCLNSFAWFMEPAKSPITHKLARAVRDATKAIQFYSTAGDETIDYRAVNWNNIAYLHSFEPSIDTFDLKAARAALREMKDVLPRDDWWYPSYPEFFHTEANLEYLEYRAALKAKRPKFDLINKLVKAREVIEKALEVERKQSYESLHDKIERALEEERDRVARQPPPPPKRAARVR